MTNQPHKINSNAENQSLEELAEEIAKRGGIMQFSTSKEMFEFMLNNAKRYEREYITGANEDGETCLYQKVLIGKVAKNGNE